MSVGEGPRASGALLGKPDRIEGYAIVSADGMIADARGQQPQALRIAADQQFLHEALARADAVAHGRNSAEGGAQTARRRRLILTRSVAAIARHPGNPNALFWNPAGASLAQAWQALGLSGGMLAVLGGTDVFGLFLELGYDAFHLTCAARYRLPGGVPVFPGVPARSPEELLASHGLKRGWQRELDAAAGVTLVAWLR